MLSPKDDTPVASLDPDRLFHGLDQADGFALGVSGGPDSMALLGLFSAWRRAAGDDRPALVLAVDHGLRDAAAAECAHVDQTAEALGLSTRILRWRPAAGTAISQTSAREGRYRLIFQAMRRFALSHLLLAHHLDDQAETIVMRLLNGSGLDGMAGMSRTARRDGFTLVRPLLDFSKADLRAWLDRTGITAFDDPSNLDEMHERTRIRKLMPLIAEAGGTVETISRFCERATRASEALEVTAASVIAACAQIDAYGFCTMDFRAVAVAPADIRIRILRQIIAAVRGVRELRLERLERAEAALFGDGVSGLTLSGCRFQRDGDALDIAREARNLPRLPRLLVPGETTVYDNRFRIGLAASVTAELTVAPLGEAGWPQVKTAFKTPPKIKPAARASLPAIRHGEHLVAVPGLDAKTLARAGLSITFSPENTELDDMAEEGPP